MFLLWGAAILCSVTMQTFSVFQGKSVQQHIIQTFRLWCWIQYFILGGLVPHIQPVLMKKLSDKQHLLLLCISSIFIVWYQYTIITTEAAKETFPVPSGNKMRET